MNVSKTIATTLAAAALAVGMAVPCTAQNHSGAIAQPPVVVRAKIDSASVTMSGRAVLNVEVIKPAGKGAMVNLPKYEPGKPNDFAGAEVREINVDSTALPEGRVRVNYQIVLQPFEPGDLSFPTFKYVMGADTFSSESVPLKVIEPMIPKLMRDSLIINPMEGPASIPARWYDYLPSWHNIFHSWWFWTILGLLIVALAGTLFYLYKKNGPSLLPRKKYIPPHMVALERLQQLKERKLAENGQDKEYYTVLTDILRQYLGGRFHIFAREMSSTQILRAIHNNREIAGYEKPIGQMLQIADYVKFAKVRALPEENVRSFNTVRDFVEQTKPVDPDPNSPEGKALARQRRANERYDKAYAAQEARRQNQAAIQQEKAARKASGQGKK